MNHEINFVKMKVFISTASCSHPSSRNLMEYMHNGSLQSGVLQCHSSCSHPKHEYHVSSVRWTVETQPHQCYITAVRKEGLEGGATNVMTSVTLINANQDLLLVSSVIASRVLAPHICSSTENNTGGMKSGMCMSSGREIFQ